MTWIGAIVLFAMIWFLFFLLLLPRGEQTQAESGAIEPGTPPGAPANLNIGRKALITTIATIVTLGLITLIVELEVVSFSDFNHLLPRSFSQVVADKN
jgi:predicted secreted protein